MRLKPVCLQPLCTHSSPASVLSPQPVAKFSLLFISAMRTQLNNTTSCTLFRWYVVLCRVSCRYLRGGRYGGVKPVGTNQGALKVAAEQLQARHELV